MYEIVLLMNNENDDKHSYVKRFETLETAETFCFDEIENLMDLDSMEIDCIEIYKEGECIWQSWCAGMGD